MRGGAGRDPMICFSLWKRVTYSDFCMSESSLDTACIPLPPPDPGMWVFLNLWIEWSARPSTYTPLKRAWGRWRGLPWQ